MISAIITYVVMTAAVLSAYVVLAIALNVLAEKLAR